MAFITAIGKKATQYFRAAASAATPPQCCSELYLAVSRFGHKPKGKTAIIQGFGNVGSWAAVYLAEQGVKIIGVLEADTNFSNPDGIDPVELMKYMVHNKKSAKGFPKGKPCGPELMYEKCDILVVAALEKAITAENAGKIRTKIIAEGANGPTTPSADDILIENKTLILPDLLCNAGGVTVSYFEFLKNLQHVSFGKLSIKFWRDSNTALLDSVEKSLKKSKVDAKVTATPAFASMMSGANEKHIVTTGLEYSMIKACSGKTAIIQGFGNVGSWAAVYLAEQGVKIIGVLEADTNFSNPDGINPVELMKYMVHNKKSAKGFPNGKPCGPELLFEKCDILVVAALEKAITAENAGKIRTKIIAEGANGPTTPSADDILIENKTLILPDLLCNAGGVTVSYFEFLKNLKHVSFGKLSIKFWRDSNTALLDSVEKSLKQSNVDAKVTATPAFASMMSGANEKHIVTTGLEYSMIKACSTVSAAAKSHNLGLDTRTAAYVTAIEKIFVTYDEHGLAF